MEWREWREWREKVEEEEEEEENLVGAVGFKYFGAKACNHNKLDPSLKFCSGRQWE